MTNTRPAMVAVFDFLVEEKILAQNLVKKIVTRYSNKENLTYIVINTTLDKFAAQVRSLKTGIKPVILLNTITDACKLYDFRAGV